MPTPVNPNMAATPAPPIMQARSWLAGITFPAERPLINLSQAAPVSPPPADLRAAMADLVLSTPEVHLYGPDLGLPALRAEVAAHWGAVYGGTVAPEQVAITSGCNHAFAAVMSTIAGQGDEVILPTPWYFNHKMWLTMNGITAVPLPSGSGLIPSADACAALITPRTRAIVLVTPNNPGGAEYPAATLRAFATLARAHGLPLIVDETYRDFDSRTGPVHDLFTDPDWDEVLIQLYSFSKAYRLTGHRVGALTTSAARLAEVEKFVDSVTICPNQLAQHSALWAMRNLSAWLAAERAEILDRRAAIIDGFQRLAGWRLLGCGAYFAYVEHPFDIASDVMAQRLVQDAGVLVLPGTMFTPAGDAGGKRQFRIAFANVDRAGIAAFHDRLAAIRY